MNKKQFRFEIIRRGDDRYYWLFVVLERRRRRRRRRVLARSTRDYRSVQKTIDAIAKLQSATNVFDTTDDAIRLPVTFFQRVPGVVPLMIEEFPVEDDEIEATPVLGLPREGPPAAQAAATEATAESPAAQAPKPTRRRASRAKRGTSAGGGKPSASR